MSGLPERSPFGIAVLLEGRHQPTDEHVSHVILPNGSVADVVGAELGASAARVAADIWTAHVRRGCCDAPADWPLCQRCSGGIHYQRAAHADGGDSCWVHTATGDPVCVDRKGRCERPAESKGTAA